MADDGKPPRVSILVPTIGRIEYLSQTCESIEAQTFGDFEVLVLDNASPPESRAVLEAWAKRDRRVRVLRVEPRIPMFPNFNRGIEAARGEYLTFCHDDDVIVPEFVARCVAFLDAHPRVGITGSNYAHIDEHGKLTEVRRPVRRTQVWPGRRYIRALLRRGRNPLTMQSIFYRRVALGPEGIDPKLSLHWGDFVVLMRIAETWDVGLLEEPLVHVRRHAAQASAAHAVSRGMEMRREMLERYVDELAERHPADAIFIRELRARIAVAHRTGMLWGWVVAGDDA
ncbi:MAG TPA: glycosyltransferase family 2 protein, partial [Labilithrix sp.]